MKSLLIWWALVFGCVGCVPLSTTLTPEEARAVRAEQLIAVTAELEPVLVAYEVDQRIVTSLQLVRAALEAGFPSGDSSVLEAFMVYTLPLVSPGSPLPPDGVALTATLRAAARTLLLSGAPQNTPSD